MVTTCMWEHNVRFSDTVTVSGLNELISTGATAAHEGMIRLVMHSNEEPHSVWQYIWYARAHIGVCYGDALQLISNFAC